MKHLKGGLLLLLILVFLFSSCKREEERTIIIAEQYGLAYAPLQIIRANETLERLIPNVKVKWVRLGNTAAIREAVIAGQVDIGFMGIPPFLIARDRGMDWQIFSGLSRSPLGLVSDSRENSSLQELLENDGGIALPQPGSIQHILLAMAAEREFGDHTAFDDQLITLKHPDGMNALLSGGVAAHFTSPPFIFQETETTEDGILPYEVLLTGKEAFGDEFTFIVGMVPADFAEENPDLIKSLKMALAEGMNIITTRPGEAAKLLAESYDMDPAILEDYLTRPGTAYTTQILGLNKFIDFLEGAGYLETFITPGEVIVE